MCVTFGTMCKDREDKERAFSTAFSIDQGKSRPATHRAEKSRAEIGGGVYLPSKL
jgi:hypothetical protein